MLQPLKECVGWSFLLIPVLPFASCSSEPRPHKNVVLISIDTLRTDRMSLYGAARRTTPAIDELAQRAVRFTNAVSPSPWTLPAHAAMLTGLNPSSLSSQFDDHLFRLAPLLSTILKQHGYRTAAVTGGGFVSKAYGANIGFDSFLHGSVDDAVHQIQSASGEPFFLFFHTYIAHVPYKDRRYTAGTDGGRLAKIYDDTSEGPLAQHLLISCGWMTPTDSEREFLLALYDGGVAAADEAVGQLLSALRRANLDEHTIVIITSDHGEEFWDHTDRAAYHGHTLYGELLRIPLVWYEPGLPIPGSTRSEPVSLVDLVPTLASRLGVEIPPGLDGLDLSPLLEGASWTVDRELFGEAVRHGPPRYSIQSAAGKLILTPDLNVQQGEGDRCPVPVLDAQELYLPDDPGEKHNRVRERPQVAGRLAEDLLRHSRSAKMNTPSASRSPLDADTLERLRALGYVE